MAQRSAAVRSEIEEWLHHQVVETYNDRVVRQFALATLVWGVLGTGLGALLALQRCWPALSFGAAWLTYERLQPLLTNGLIYAFAGSALLASAYYCVQRSCHVRLFSDRLAAFTFWGWQATAVAAAAAQSFPITAQLQLLVALGPAIVWIACAAVFLSTLVRRRVARIAVANWFFASFIVVLAVLHVLESLAACLRVVRAYVAYADSISAGLQSWSGHNTEGFFLTAGFFGMVYFFMPRQAQRPVYSRRLALLQLSALIAVYVWAGPYDLHYDSLPLWVQSLGLVFSVMLLAGAWAGMVNGLLTLAGAWERLRGDWVLLFMVVSLCFYGLSSFEGPLMSLTPPNCLPQYAGWLLGHVHSGVLGWVALMTIGAMYQLIPQLVGRERMYSVKLVDAHFWLAVSGLLLYLAALWIAATMQRALIEDGAATLELAASITPLPFRLVRLLGNVLFCSGMGLMAYNAWMTVRGMEPMAVPVTAPEAEREMTPAPSETSGAIRR